jgi:hypothetical protein
MEAVYILVNGNGIQYLLIVDVWRERQLHQYAIHLVTMTDTQAKCYMETSTVTQETQDICVPVPNVLHKGRLQLMRNH